ncbi:MAG: corrinoid protein [Oscillospiraceae bacterium]|nr:corrinoid protein [Oscillospiraceae bacterium]
MQILTEISENLQKGKAKIVTQLVEQALAEGVPADDILQVGMMPGMDIIATKFKNNEVFVPEVLIAARAMNQGTALLKPHLDSASSVIGKCVLGTVKGDLHDIGKNLVRMMLEGKGIEVIDLGVDVPAEKFVAAIAEHQPDCVALSALLTTTMGEITATIAAIEVAGLRDSVSILVGGAPVTESFCQEIGADIYQPDAASAAEAAKAAILAKKAA